MVVPNDQIRLDYLKVISKNLKNTLHFTFGDLFMKKSTECLKRTIDSHPKTKQQLDTFFSLLKHRFMSRNASASLRKTQDKSLNKKRSNFLDTIKSKFINAIPFFDLPVDLKCDLDATLSDIEAQEFIDLENSYYKNRRQFTISGSALFYKDYLVSTHLSKNVTKRVHEYCEHYGLFNLVRNGSTNQFHIWKEIFIESNTDSCRSRYFLIISGLKEFLYAIILESGGVISRQIERNQLIEPDPFYIQQTTFILTDIHDNGIMAEIEHCFKGYGTKEALFNINKFVTNKKKATTAKTRSNSKSRSPLRLGNMLSLRGKGPDEKKTSVNDMNSGTEIKGPGTSDIYHFHKEQRHMSPSASLATLGQRTDSDCQLRDEKKFFNDISLQESIIYYAQSDSSQEGIFFPPPKQVDFNSNLFVRVFSHFVQSCFKIRNLFESTIINDESKETLLEQGVLFNMTIDEPKSDNSQSKPKEINFWVVGRRKVYKSDASSKWLIVKDFYVCFNDTIDQVLLELAFDVGFGKLTI